MRLSSTGNLVSDGYPDQTSLSTARHPRESTTITAFFSIQGPHYIVCILFPNTKIKKCTYLIFFFHLIFFLFVTGGVVWSYLHPKETVRAATGPLSLTDRRNGAVPRLLLYIKFCTTLNKPILYLPLKHLSCCFFNPSDRNIGNYLHIHTP